MSPRAALGANSPAAEPRELAGTPASAAPNPNPRPVEFDDVQGLLRFGYKHLTHACFMLMRVRDAAAARAWLAAAPVTNAVAVDAPPSTALQLALTCAGLRELGVADDVIESFAPEFIDGMTGNHNRSRRLGDIGPNAPEGWDWGHGDGVPHVMLLLYAAPDVLPGWAASIEAQCGAGLRCIGRLQTSNLRGVEPFGFVDGVSQPKLDWERRRPVRDHDELEYRNLACLGEFVLGYPNEYGLYTDRPLLRTERAGALPRAEDTPERADLGRNGSYLVLRQLEQHVHRFWQWLDRAADGDAASRQRLAEAMVGRTMDGVPLVGSTSASDLNVFTYRADPDGVRCPLGAHIRRTNPRNADLPPGAAGLISRLVRILGFDADARRHDLVASTRFHRLLRRGREYGPPVSIDDALHGTPTQKSGLHFICLGASIARQFEFVQAAWITGTRFDGLSGENDPLLGHREPDVNGASTDGFSMPCADAPTRHLSGLPPFVTVRGGAYFFMPGLRALRWLAGVR